MQIILPVDIIYLFDEFGTPSFSRNRRNDLFIGVAVIYEESIESDMFSKCCNKIGLNNKNPKKNNEFNFKGLIDFYSILLTFPIQIYSHYIDLNNDLLRQTLLEYNSIGNHGRLNIRSKNEEHIRERKLDQTIRSHILTYSFHEAISNLLLKTEYPLYHIYPFIDNISIPVCDKELYLTERSKELEKSVDKLMNVSNKKGKICINQIGLLENKGEAIAVHRKRFIDSITSLISRAIPANKSNYEKELEHISTEINCYDMTNFMISYCQSNIIDLNHEINMRLTHP